MDNLTLTELESLYNLINKGFYDGHPTEYIKVEAEGYQYGHEKWKKLLDERESLLRKIKIKISNRINDILKDGSL